VKWGLSAGWVFGDALQSPRARWGSHPRVRPPDRPGV